METNKKIAIRGSIVYGAEIINYLKLLGARNETCLSGKLETIFYYNRQDGIINGSSIIPEGYTEVKFPTHPKEMYISDNSEEDAYNKKEKVWVFGKIENMAGLGLYLCQHDDNEFIISYKYAVDIPEEKEDINISFHEVLEHYAEKYNTTTDKIKIVE
jgi:hypothetical protein